MRNRWAVDWLSAPTVRNVPDRETLPGSWISPAKISGESLLHFALTSVSRLSPEALDPVVIYFIPAFLNLFLPQRDEAWPEA